MGAALVVGKIMSSDDFTMIAFDREPTEPELVVNDIMGEAAWLEKERWLRSVVFGAKVPEALEDRPFMESYVDNCV